MTLAYKFAEVASLLVMILVAWKVDNDVVAAIFVSGLLITITLCNIGETLERKL